MPDFYNLGGVAPSPEFLPGDYGPGFDFTPRRAYPQQMYGDQLSRQAINDKWGAYQRFPLNPQAEWSQQAFSNPYTRTGWPGRYGETPEQYNRWTQTEYNPATDARFEARSARNPLGQNSYDVDALSVLDRAQRMSDSYLDAGMDPGTGRFLGYQDPQGQYQHGAGLLFQSQSMEPAPPVKQSTMWGEMIFNPQTGRYEVAPSLGAYGTVLGRPTTANELQKIANTERQAKLARAYGNDVNFGGWTDVGPNMQTKGAAGLRFQVGPGASPTFGSGSAAGLGSMANRFDSQGRYLPGTGGGGGGFQAGGDGGIRGAFADATGQTGGQRQYAPAQGGGSGYGGTASPSGDTFSDYFGMANDEANRAVEEGRSNQQMARNIMQQQANTPGISDQTVRDMQGNILRHAGRSAAMGQRDLREGLARQGLGSGARGVEYARRSRAEAGPSVAASFTNTAIQAALANAQARRQSMGGLANLYMADPYRRDYTSELQMLSERDRYSQDLAQKQRDMEMLRPFLARMMGQQAPVQSGWGVNAPAGQ